MYLETKEFVEYGICDDCGKSGKVDAVYNFYEEEECGFTYTEKESVSSTCFSCGEH